MIANFTAKSQLFVSLFGVYCEKPVEAESQEHMPKVKKDRPLPAKPIDEAQAIAAIEVLLSATQTTGAFFDATITGNQGVSYRYSSLSKALQDSFDKTYYASYNEVASEIWKWYAYIFADGKELPAKDIFDRYIKCIAFSNSRPMRIAKFHEFGSDDYFVMLLRTPKWAEWAFRGFVYVIEGNHSDDEARLLILEDFDKKRQRLEKLKAKFDDTPASETTYERERIPENVRIEVWRRDGGKCAKCGSQEKLEYDHIIPISKGGSNTARNIELLCEKHNRSKSNNII